MIVNYKKQSGNLFLYLNGELDEYSASPLRKEVDKLIDNNLSADRVIMNFSNITFMDSTGIGFLLGRYRRLKEFNMPLYIENPNNVVDKILSLSGIYNIMPKL